MVHGRGAAHRGTGCIHGDQPSEWPSTEKAADTMAGGFSSFTPLLS